MQVHPLHPLATPMDSSMQCMRDTVAEVAIIFLGDVDVVVDNVMVVAVVVIAVLIVVLLVARVVVYLVMFVDEARSNHFEVTETQLL